MAVGDEAGLIDKEDTSQKTQKKGTKKNSISGLIEKEIITITSSK